MGPCVRRDDVDRYDFAFSRRDAPGVLHFVCPPRDRGRREDRVRAAPAVSRAICRKRMCTRAYRNSGEHPAFPAQWLYSLYVIVLVTGFVCHHRSQEAFASPELDASTGASDPHDFAVRNDIVRPHSKPARNTIASTATSPNVCDDGRRPTGGKGWRELCR